MKVQSKHSFRSKAQAQNAESTPKCETSPKVQNTQMIMRFSMKLWYERERIYNTASTHKGDLIAKAPNHMGVENAKLLPGVKDTGETEQTRN